jgi:chaperonin cofactor prefoldin
MENKIARLNDDNRSLIRRRDKLQSEINELKKALLEAN